MRDEQLRLLTAKEVCRLASISNATLYRLIKAGTIPKPLKIGPQVTRFRADEIAAWIEARSAERVPVAA